MKVLDFYADYMKWEGTVWYKGKGTFRLPTSWDKMLFCKLRSGRKRDEYRYEYYLLKQKKNTEKCYFFLALVGVLNQFTAEEQYNILEQMKTIELDFDLTDEELRSNPWNPSPLFSVRGTCGKEKTCKRDCACRTIYFESCCRDRKVGYSWVASILNPKYYAFLTDLVVWKALCPEMDVLFVSHDSSPECSDNCKLDYRFAFVIRDDKITYVKDREEVEKLYQIYNEKYPCEVKMPEA